MEAAREGNGDSRGDGDGGQLRLHPLMIPTVLEVLFAKLPSNDIASCRLVCKKWLNESLSSWRTNATINFEGSEILQKRKRNFTDTSTSLVEFLDFFENECGAKFKFKQFYIRWWHRIGDVKQVASTRFAEVVGTHVTSLTLSSCSFSGRDAARKIMYERFPNLRFLKMQKCEIVDSTESEDIPSYKEHGLRSLHLEDCLPDSITEMLSHFPMLTSIHMNQLCPTGSIEPIECHQVMELLNAIKVVKSQDPNKLPIRFLDVGAIHFNLDSEEEQAEHLREGNLPLHRLVIKLGHCDGCSFLPIVFNQNAQQHGEIIKEALRLHSSTLEHFYGNENVEGLCRKVPTGNSGNQFENVEEVEITLSSHDNLNWLKYTPNLRRLIIQPHLKILFILNCSKSLFSNSSELLEIGKLRMLKNLEFNLSISPDNLKRLGKWMPNVETLKIKLNDENFPTLCEHWKQLRSLTDLGRGLTDKGVTGIRMDEIEGDDGKTLLRGWTRVAPNITDLESLTHFKTRGELTASSVYNGFLKMPSLKALYYHPTSKIDAEAEMALKRKGIERVGFS